MLVLAVLLVLALPVGFLKLADFANSQTQEMSMRDVALCHDTKTPPREPLRAVEGSDRARLQTHHCKVVLRVDDVKSEGQITNLLAEEVSIVVAEFRIDTGPRHFDSVIVLWRAARDYTRGAVARGL